jgi:hypothetical protein
MERITEYIENLDRFTASLLIILLLWLLSMMAHQVINRRVGGVSGAATTCVKRSATHAIPGWGWRLLAGCGLIGFRDWLHF